MRKEAPDVKEFAGLEQSGLRRLADAENEANCLESRFDLAYNAAHALCLAALRHTGYRATNRHTDPIHACKIVAAALHKLPPVT